MEDCTGPALRKQLDSLGRISSGVTEESEAIELPDNLGGKDLPVKGFTHRLEEATLSFLFSSENPIACIEKANSNAAMAQ